VRNFVHEVPNECVTGRGGVNDLNSTVLAVVRAFSVTGGSIIAPANPGGVLRIYFAESLT